MDSGIMDRKLKILFVASEIFPDENGGVQTYIYNVAKGLAGRGHSVFALTRKVRNDAPDTEIIDGINVHRYEVKKHKLAFLSQISWIINGHKVFEKLITNFDFDLINLHSPQAAFGVNLSAKSKGIPKVYTFHALLHEEELLSVSDVKYPWSSWRKYIKPVWLLIYLCLMKWLEKKGLEKSFKIITLSDYTTRCLIEKHKVSTDKIVKISGGVDAQKFTPVQDKGSVRKALGLSLNNNILFTVRRLVPRMGLDNLIKAMPAVLKKRPGTILVIGGKGPLKLELQKLIDKLQLQKEVFLKGFIADGDLPSYYQSADLFVLPSKKLEGFGMVTLEALACGTPVLGTRVGGTVEILNGLDNKLLFRNTSSESIADLIMEYLVDTKKRQAIESKSRKFVLDNYTWENAVGKTEKLFIEESKSNLSK